MRDVLSGQRFFVAPKAQLRNDHASSCFICGGCHSGSSILHTLGRWQSSLPGWAVGRPQRSLTGGLLEGGRQERRVGAVLGPSEGKERAPVVRVSVARCPGGVRADGLGLVVWLRLCLGGDLLASLAWTCPLALPLPSQPSPFLAPADASDAKAREQRRGGPLPTSSSKEAPKAQDPR